MKKYLPFITLFLLIFYSLEGGQCHIGEPLVIKHSTFYQVRGPKGESAIQIIAVPGNILDWLQCRIKRGKLLIDTGKICDLKKNQNKYVFRFYGPIISDVWPSGYDDKVISCFKFTIKGPEKSSGILRFEGIRNDGKHFITHHDFQMLKQKETFIIKDFLPADLKKFWMVAVLTSPGKFEIDVPYFYTEKQITKKLDPTINYLPNGGAEHGFDGTIFIPPEARAFAHNNQILDWSGIAEKPIKVDLTCDDKIFHSGKKSFRFRINSEALPSIRGGIFLFQPVPYENGAAISFSIWLKADHATKVGLELTFGNGIGVTKQVTIGSEWKKFELYIPEWGKPGRDYKTQGQILNTFHLPPKRIIPKVTISNNVTVWMDDAAVHLGGRGSYQEKSAAFVRSAVLDHPDHTYFPKEPIKAKLVLEGNGASDEPFKISYAVYDLWGRCVLHSGYRNLMLAKDKESLQNFNIKMPSDFLGPVNIIFTIDGGKNGKVRRIFYAGIVNKPGKLNKKFSVEVPVRQNVELLIPIIKRFGIGMIRCGGASGQVHETTYIMPYFKRHGIDVLLNYSMTVYMRKYPKKSLTEHLKNFEGFIKKNSAYITVLETENESNIFMNAEKTRKLIQAESRIVRKINPQIKIAGPAACKTDFSWIENALIKGGVKELDIVSEHPYRMLAEEPDYGEDCLSIRRLLDHYNPALKHYATEAGSVQVPVLWNNKIDDYLRHSQAKDLRLALIGLGNMLDSFNFFSLNVTASGIGWNLLFMGNKENGGVCLPTPLLFAIRHAADMIGDGKVCKSISLNGPWRGILFDKGISRTAIIWKYKDAPAVYSLKKEMQVTDAFGRKLNPNHFMVGEWPVYVESVLSPNELAQLIKKKQPHSSDEHALMIKSKLISSHKFIVSLKNIANRTVKNILVKNEESEKKISCLEPGDETIVPLVSNKKQVNIQVTGESIPVQRIVIKLDGLFVPHKGNFSAPITIPETNRICTEPSEIEYLKKCSGTLSAAWDIEYLYFKIKVKSPEFHAKPDMQKINKLWCYDSVQIGFDTLSNGKKGDITLADDDFEYTVGEVGGRPTVFRANGSSSVHDSLMKEIGITSDADVKITKNKGLTEYLIRFKTKGISPFKLQAGSSMRYNILLNFHRNGKRIGFLQMSPGFGEKKCAGEWNSLILLPSK